MADAPSLRDAPPHEGAASGDAMPDVAAGTRDVGSRDAATPGCEILGVFYPTNHLNPKNSCQSCQPAVSGVGWSDVPDGSPCETGECGAGSCVPTCPGSCMLDTECQTKCPAVASPLLNCCDQTQSMCYVTGAPACPDQQTMCPSQCTSDLECQNDCPVSPSGTPLCCNPQTSKCTPSSASACPSPTACDTALGCGSNMDCGTFCPAAPAGFANCCYLAKQLLHRPRVVSRRLTRYPLQRCPESLHQAPISLRARYDDSGRELSNSTTPTDGHTWLGG